METVIFHNDGSLLESTATTTESAGSLHRHECKSAEVILLNDLCNRKCQSWQTWHELNNSHIREVIRLLLFKGVEATRDNASPKWTKILHNLSVVIENRLYSQASTFAEYDIISKPLFNFY